MNFEHEKTLKMKSFWGGSYGKWQFIILLSSNHKNNYRHHGANGDVQENINIYIIKVSIKIRIRIRIRINCEQLMNRVKNNEMVWRTEEDS